MQIGYKNNTLWYARGWVLQENIWFWVVPVHIYPISAYFHKKCWFLLITWPFIAHLHKICKSGARPKSSNIIGWVASRKYMVGGGPIHIYLSKDPGTLYLLGFTKKHICYWSCDHIWLICIKYANEVQDQNPPIFSRLSASRKYMVLGGSCSYLPRICLFSQKHWFFFDHVTIYSSFA